MGSTSRKSVLITGCSKGGLGDALARAFHDKGFRVLASARNPKKMAHLVDLGIETVILDVQSQESIQAAVKQVSQLTGNTLDILINNSGGGYMMPVVDSDLSKVRELLELNFVSPIAVIQAFLPLLRQSAPGSIIANNTSVSSVLSVPTQGIYSASKAALALVTDALRTELDPFGIKVIELKTAMVTSVFFTNQAQTVSTEGGLKLPAGSIYEPVKDKVEDYMNGVGIAGQGMDADVWAKKVVGDLTKSSPAAIIWRGKAASLMWFIRTFLWHTVTDFIGMKLSGMDKLAAKLKDQKKLS